MFDGYDLVDQLYANYLYGNWTASDGPFKGARALVITVNHPVPFFDDSYAVDSANVGPYGTAIWEELVPEIERRYRGIGEGWARGVLGGSQSRVLMTRGRDHELEPPAPARARECRFVSREDFQ